MFIFIKNLFRNPRGTGALVDPRTAEEKKNDYRFEEIVACVNPVEWIEKKEYRTFPIFDQDGSGSCVAQTIAKLLGIMYWLKNQSYVHFSATHVYQRRNNKPKPGMSGVDALDIARQGVTLEELVPSQKMNDEQMDCASIPDYKKQVGEIFKIGNYVLLPIKDIDTVASTIQTTRKGVMVWFYFERDEWTNVPEIKHPEVTLSTPNIARHSVTAVDWTLYNGKKALVIEDSWGTSYGIAGQRIITEDFFKARNWFAAYPINFKFEEMATPKPKYNFQKQLEFGQTDKDVEALQMILRYEGLFPENVGPTLFYGAITAKGVLAFQKKHNVAPMAELDSLQGRVVGPKTILKLNQLYN